MSRTLSPTVLALVLPLVAACSTMATTETADAEQIDIEKITCEEFEALDAQRRRDLFIWANGFFSAIVGSSVIDTAAMAEDYRTIRSLCAEEPNAPMTVLARLNRDKFRLPDAWNPR